MLAVCCAVAGAAAIAGVLAWNTHQARRAGQLDGICIALDMVMAHGLMDEPRRAMVSEAITSPINPYFDRIDLKRSEITRNCQRVAAERWNWK